MNRQEFLTYASERYGVSPEFPFMSDQTIAVFRHGENRKWFAVVMTISAEKLGLMGGMLDVVNLKCDPEVIYSFHSYPGMFPAYHMNKRHWITAVLDQRTDPEQIKWILDISYDLTGIKRKK